MNIDSIKNGIVIDHITAGLGMTVYNLLKLDQLDCAVAIIKNAKVWCFAQRIGENLDFSCLGRNAVIYEQPISCYY